MIFEGYVERNEICFCGGFLGDVFGVQNPSPSAGPNGRER